MFLSALRFSTRLNLNLIASSQLRFGTRGNAYLASLISPMTLCAPPRFVKELSESASYVASRTVFNSISFDELTTKVIDPVSLGILVGRYTIKCTIGHCTVKFRFKFSC